MRERGRKRKRKSEREQETISSRSSRQLVSVVLKSCYGQPSATTGELLSARRGWVFLSLLLSSSATPFSLSLRQGIEDEWASWGGFRPEESCAPCARSSTSGKNSIPWLKGMTRSSCPYSPSGNFHESRLHLPSFASCFFFALVLSRFDFLACACTCLMVS